MSKQYHLGIGENAHKINETTEAHTSQTTFQLHPQDHVYRHRATIHEKWRITSGERRPDGVLKRVYLINDAFPGPTLEARSGDNVVISVENGLENDEGVSLHWHGLSMRGANEYDGAVGLTQIPIAKGQSYNYSFTIEEGQHGTFWYHAHDGVQRADGLFGGVVVHQPRDAGDSRTVDNEHLLMIGDWYHRSAEQALDFYMHAGSFGNEPVPDNILLNGVGAYNCSDAVPARPLNCELRAVDELPTLKVDPSRRTVLRIVNVGAYAGVEIKMPGALLTPFAVDGGNEIKKMSASSLGFLQPGERVGVLIQLDPKEPLARLTGVLAVTLDTRPFKYPNSALTSTHYFPFGWIGTANQQSTYTTGPLDHLNLDSVEAAHDQSSILPKNADRTIVLYTITQKLARLNNVPHGSINNTYWEPQASPPAPLITLNREQWDEHQLVPQIPYNPDSPLWIDIVLNNLDEEGHPFHLHGYDFWVLSTYSSTFNWGSYNPFHSAEPPGGAYDLVNAVEKDTVLVPRRGYAVLRFRADNPGIWMFHCHVLWHQASGMAMAFQVGD
ncbi:hypothetical protein LTR36_009025 [Oleoguttula mirabilis]|uniref:Laccase n=1 Tax=Oleoguttula mirabilis TaxID=1507867 RepID=A0AAV9J6S3_9PEZI|nr:hypothetical protein LTR36_009025 [Oleoguttula mirabilis]